MTNKIRRGFWIIGLLAISPAISMAHDLEDGFVERAVQLRIRDGKLEIEYTIGLTEPTMAELLKNAVQDYLPPTTSNLIEKSVPSDSGLGGEDSVREKYKMRFKSLIMDNLNLTVNGLRQTITCDSVADYPKHHYDFVFNFSCEMSSIEKCKLVLEDSNFAEQDGGARYALKSSGKWIISRSNVAPIIIRSNRHDLSSLKPDQRQNACKILASIAVAALETKD